jgi:succinyl-diaminopimelate desuccinylase
MNGGLAVMIELAGWAHEPSRAIDLAFLFFVREELPAHESALPRVFAEAQLVHDADLVIVLEPTDNAIHAGCLGNLNATLTFRGESAHSARPWQGVNAIGLAVEGLTPVVACAPLEVEVGGLTFVEVLSATGIAGGIADNVVPDRVDVRLNYRYAPSRTPAEAEARLRELVGAEVEVTSNSPPAHVATGSPLVERLRAAGGLAVEPKQAWTPVAEFAAQGLDAVNLGPGATRYAHRRDERVEIAEVERTFETLRRFAS